jgi:hypothetical protein
MKMMEIVRDKKSNSSSNNKENLSNDKVKQETPVVV